MAAAKPIVSTAVSDVKHHFVPVVAVADSHDEFIAMVGRALETPDEEMIARGLVEARNNTWDSVVGRMDRIVAEAVRARDLRSTRAARSFGDRVPADTDASWAARPARSRLIAASEGSGD
jgi:hypothetical protein